MHNILSFYSNLLTIEITVFLAVLATIFVFIQLLYSNYSFRYVSYIFKDTILIFYFIISIVVVAFTSLGVLSIILEKYTFIFINTYSIISVISGFFLSICILIIFILNNVKYLRPSTALLLSIRNINYKNIRMFLFKKYGIRSPDEVAMFNFYDNFPSGIEYDSQKSDEEKIDLDKIDFDKLRKSFKLAKKTNANYLRAMKEFKILNRKVKKVINPLQPISDLGLKSIVRADFQTLIEVKNAFCDISDGFIRKLPKLDKKEWSFDSGLGNIFLNEIIENLDNQLELSESKNLDLFKLSMVDISNCLFNSLYSYEKNNLIPLIFSFWKRTADLSITKSQKLFIKIMHFYRDSSKKLFKKFDINKKVIEINIRDVGWLGERLLKKNEIEIKPLIYDYDYSNEYDALLECIFSFENEYKNYPDADPYVYFEILDVILEKEATIIAKAKQSIIKDNFFQIAYIYYSFGEEAMRKGNGRGAGLSVQYIFKAYEMLKKNDFNEDAESVLKLLLKYGGVAHGFGKNLKELPLTTGSIDEFVVDKMSEIKEDFPYESEFREMFIKSYEYGGTPEVRKYIKKFKEKMNRDFGFNLLDEN